MDRSVLELIQSSDAAVRDRALAEYCEGMSLEALSAVCDELEAFWRSSDNLYERVRALFFLASIHRFHLPAAPDLPSEGKVPYDGVQHLMKRRFEEAIDAFLQEQGRVGMHDPLCSAFASAYHHLGFQTLANQVRRSVRSVRGNQWMFRMGHPADHPLQFLPELTEPGSNGVYPLLREVTPVRMDLTHSGWSDIFFLGMDYPEGARVLNVSIDLAVKGRDSDPQPPVEACLRVIDEPLLRLVSVDLGVSADIDKLSDVYDFAKDYLGLLKAAVISAGVIPPGMEGSGVQLSEVLERLVGPGKGLEMVSRVNGIPKGSRLAVSTNLLAGLISVCMRATGQTESLEGPLTEAERRIVASRAILGEWLGGSGGGWQDSGGVWPGIKLIEGSVAEAGDPEHGISRGRLLPQHRILGDGDLASDIQSKLQESLILVHGGMAQNVGPILEMVTEKYLLRSQPEWDSRGEAIGLLDEMLDALRRGDIKAVGEITTRNFFGPLQRIIPWASNHYTERLIHEIQTEYGDRFWGFWMLGGMSGGGMGFIVDPSIRSEAQAFLQRSMLQAKQDLQHALPFAMDPVVYNFAVNEQGSSAGLLRESEALMPVPYYAQALPQWVRTDPRKLPAARRAELAVVSEASKNDERFGELIPVLFDQLLPRESSEGGAEDRLQSLLDSIGFDSLMQEEIRQSLLTGQLGLSQNRLPASTRIEDVKEGDVLSASHATDAHRQLGEEALRSGTLAVVTLAAGTGSRWTQGAGVVKGLNPFCRLDGGHRSFVEVHLAKSRKVSETFGSAVPHVFTTSYLTDEPIRSTLKRVSNYGYEGSVYCSRGQSVGVRMVPMARDLRFAWEEMPQQLLDEQAQKMRESLNGALINWARETGEASDYTDNLALQCLHPVGHWFEVPNLLRNGVLADLLDERPDLETILLHNIDTTGANPDPAILGMHLESGADLSFEVISRRIEDAGGGLGRVNDRVQLIEGLALPSEELDYELSYYNSMTTWISVAALLKVFKLERSELRNEEKVSRAIRKLAARLPTYVTIKDVKKRWGHGQEDVFPISQYEKLWSDMTMLPELNSSFIHVDRMRGQQLKDPAQLDGWVNDGSSEYVEALCKF